MSSGIASIALLTPIAASSAIFSARRASRGVDNMDENPLFALANFQLAGGQVLKAGVAAKEMGVPLEFDSAKKKIRELVPEKALKTTKKVLTFTADNINPLIVGTSAIKVLGSDDKWDTAARESTGLLCMFGAERAAKEFLGMPSYNVKNNNKSQTFEGSYKNIFTEKQIDAIKDFCGIKENTKKAKAIVGGAKGLLFVGASIAGYEIGSKIADAVLGKEKEDKKA